MQKMHLFYLENATQPLSATSNRKKQSGLIMRKRVLQSSNRIIAFLMAIMGFAGSCKDEVIVAAYGSPHADFVVKGIIVSAKDNTALKGIRVIAKVSDYANDCDTVKTDATGNYSTKVSSYPDTKVKLNLTDIDGVANGSFEPLDTLVTFTNAKFTAGDGHWYSGTTEKVLNLKMKPKE